MPATRHRAPRWRASILLVGACAAFSLGLAGPAAASPTQVSFDLFHAQLARYGSWHDSANLGRVWIPRVHVIGWHPYTYGHWVYADVGWTWVSDYEWGAIPYHYGTWAIDRELGWVWVPGYVWAPAWVVFRSGPRYVGWAPVPPSYSVGAANSFSDCGADHFVFVRASDFLAPHVQSVAVPVARARAVFGDTEIIDGNLRIEDGVVVNRGIDVARVERVARAPLESAPIERVPRVAPVTTVTRDALRIDPDRIERGQVRAAATGEES